MHSAAAFADTDPLQRATPDFDPAWLDVRESERWYCERERASGSTRARWLRFAARWQMGPSATHPEDAPASRR